MPHGGPATAPNYLKFKMAITIARDACRRQLRWISRYVHDHSICTTSVNHHGLCRADAGGPLQLDDNTVIGIATLRTECKDRRPDIFVNIFPLLNFIEQHTGRRP